MGYKIVKEFRKLKRITAHLPKSFNGKSTIDIITATEEELEHIYEVIGNHKHIEKTGAAKESPYEKQIKLGDANFNKGKYEDAKKNYEKASELDSKNDYPTEKIIEIEEKLKK